MTVEEVRPVVSALRCKKKKLKLHSQNIHSVAKKFRFGSFACVFIVRFASCVYVRSVHDDIGSLSHMRLTHWTNEEKISGTITGNYVRTNSSSSSALRKKHVDQMTEEGRQDIAAVVVHRAKSSQSKTKRQPHTE